MYKPSTVVWQPSALFLFKLSVITAAVAGVGLTTGCSSTPSTPKVQSSKQLGLLDANSLDSLEDLLSATDMRAVEGDRLLILKHGDVWKRMIVGFKMDENKWDPRIDAQRSWFISRQPYLDRLSARASRYLYHTVKEAERRGLPTELALLPIIESSYDPAATSSAAAAGMWQFIPSTGKIYGLRQSTYYDGRRDVVESTRAAYEFLGSLYNQFGSWELALAAYNAGPGRIQQAINRNRAAGLPTDYWSLRLPQETMNYVPRFLAVAQIVKSQQKYGISLPPIANRPHFREINVPSGASLNEIASLAGLSRAELYQLNPGHRGETIDVSSPGRILIPVDSSSNVDAKVKKLKTSASNGYWAGINSPVSSSVSTSKSSVSASSVSKTTSNNSASNQPYVSLVTKPTPLSNPFNGVNSSSVSSSQPKSTSSNKTNSRTPMGSAALASFAAAADVPSAPRIPVAVTSVVSKPIATEPPISTLEREKIIAAVKKDSPVAITAEQKFENAIEPQPTSAEKDEVVKEIRALAPAGTEIVDPLDGKIKLTAIQTSQSVASQRGSEVKVGFSYPKAVTDQTPVNSDEARRNQGKAYVKTDTEIVVSAPTGKRSTYAVMPGDTLALIAAKNGVTWRDIAKWNQVDPNSTLFVGSILYLYDAKPQSLEPKASDKPSSYVVQPSDSLTALASQFNMPIQQLAEINGLSVTSNLMVGQKLSLVESAVKKSAAVDKANRHVSTIQNTKVKTKVYLVQRGEYLQLIAARYGYSNQELAALTAGLTASSSLTIGQKINVPVNVVSAMIEESVKPITARSSSMLETQVDSLIKTENYKVQSGDTLYSIAAKSKMSLNELAELNKLSIAKGLMVGQSIKVPVGLKTTTSSVTVASVPESYTVQSGDSLNSVANKYDLTVLQLATLNDLTTTSGLRVGQKLKLNADVATKTASTTSKLPTNVKRSDVHTVSSGESLASIARKYSLQPNYLADLNGLSRSANVMVGQKLKIEGETPAKENLSVVTSKLSSKNTESYTVKAGESLNVLASRAGISVKELAEMNNLTARSSLQRGQSLQMPKTVVEYKVKSGDSLIRLAARYGVETQKLADMNDMKPNAALRVGETLKVPNL